MHLSLSLPGCGAPPPSHTPLGLTAAASNSGRDTGAAPAAGSARSAGALVPTKMPANSNNADNAARVLRFTEVRSVMVHIVT